MAIVVNLWVFEKIPSSVLCYRYGQNRTKRNRHHWYKETDQVPEEAGYFTCWQISRLEWRDQKGRLLHMPQVWQGTSPDYEGG